MLLYRSISIRIVTDTVKSLNIGIYCRQKDVEFRVELVLRTTVLDQYYYTDAIRLVKHLGLRLMDHFIIIIQFIYKSIAVYSKDLM